MAPQAGGPMRRYPERLETERLVLRRPVAADAAAIFEEYASDPEVTRYMIWRPHRSIDDTTAFRSHAEEGWASGLDLSWGITLKGEDRIVGMIGARPNAHKVDIGYVLGRKYWGRGIMTEAG